jgi:Concanavalin A-like lectin/glucanases superfamily
MTALTFILAPLLVLPIVMLFRFVGCGQFLAVGGRPRPPRYRDYIMGEPNNPGDVKHASVSPNKNNVIAYWRLLELEGGDTADDEKQFQNGKYIVIGALPHVPFAPGPPVVTGSEQASGNFIFKQPSLVTMDAVANCRIYTGGHVRVDFKPGLYTEEFTIEAWVDPDWGANFESGYEHTLFSAGGHYQRPFDLAPAFHGFTVFASRGNRWQVRLQDGQELFSSPPAPIVSRDEKTHLAVTMQNDGGLKRVRLFVNGKSSWSRSGLFYSLPNDAPLFIGIKNLKPSPAETADFAHAVISKVQEVVLHNKALSQEEIENHVDINRWP